MTLPHVEFFDESHEKSNEPETDAKNAMLAQLFPEMITNEMTQLHREGYDVSVGRTYDAAYEAPDKISDVYLNLRATGKEFASRMGMMDRGREAILSAMRYGVPIGIARNWSKQRLANREEKAEELRSNLLYNQLHVQGWPWHEQAGTALALGTIVDAHELQLHTNSYRNGIYNTMSGRLTDDILTHQFGENTGWLSKKNLKTTLTESKMKFRNKTNQDAAIETNLELEKLGEFVSAPVHKGFKDIVEYCTDSLGIRSRKEEVRTAINEHVEKLEKDDILLASIGCGTALPMLEVMQDIMLAGKNPTLILIDQDPVALAAAEQFAIQMGLADAVEIHCEKLFLGKGKLTKLLNLQDVFGDRKLDICEDSGLREYFPDFLYRDLTTQAWNALSDGGIMTTGNMNKNRPQPEFLHGLMGWPIPVKMRRMKDMARLHTEAGIPKASSRFRVTQEGVYTLCFSEKPSRQDS